MRKALVLALAGLFALTACGSKEAGSATPAGVPTTTTTVDSPTTEPDTPTTKADSPTTKGGAGGPLTLGPDDHAVSLGDTEDKVVAAGWTLYDIPNANPGCPKGATLGTGTVVISTKDGVAGIVSNDTDMHTPEGIKEGSTLADVKKAYPEAPVLGSSMAFPVPGNEKAIYTIFLTDDKVSGIFLTLKSSPC